MSKLNNTLPNNQSKNKSKGKGKNNLKNENGNTAYQNLWDTTIAALRWMFTAINLYIGKI